ncbi:hypothetical protein EEB18_021420 [Sphingopyxis sp. OPL5]|uniref:hypothetical protein n=1 Tax=Sphingopyxis sp. OPL5 TaxID=2486273 RepID=UPI00164CF38E|nr:hypothetical protein [Sphingopyxis sp. OPL5]QNO27231.1 hypothetical protein EEB18_021420 [Sphingopyxis sp. OPL5]
MKSNVTVISIAIALIVGFGAGFILRPVIAPARQTVATAEPVVAIPVETAPRATQYFAAHLDEARHVVAGCQSGSVRGAECDNAGQAVTEAEGRARFRKFMGN